MHGNASTADGRAMVRLLIFRCTSLAASNQAISGSSGRLAGELAGGRFPAVATRVRGCDARAVGEYFWPDDEVGPRAHHAWPATVESLPVGSHVTGKVIGRQQFGVFISIDQAPDAVGLVRVTALPRDTDLPAQGEAVEGQVLWHESRNCQVIVTPLENRELEPDAVSVHRLDALRRALSGE